LSSSLSERYSIPPCPMPPKPRVRAFAQRHSCKPVYFQQREDASFPQRLIDSLHKKLTSSIVISGRFCSDLLPIECCLPCPSTEWLYPDNFNTITDSANWINVASAICSVFLVASFAFLPVEKTHRHYLSVCLAIGTLVMSVSNHHCIISTTYTDSVQSSGSSFLSEQSQHSATMQLLLMTCRQIQHVPSQARS
jgi:hypothetical protein